MSEFISRFKEVFCGKKEHVGSSDRLKMSDIKETLMEMGYEPEEGSKSSVLVFEFGKAHYEVRYEDYRLDIRMYIFSEDLSVFNIFKCASERVNNELAMVKSAIKLREDGIYFVLFGYNVFVESKNEFKKFFPWYLREIKDGYVWFDKYVQELFDNMRYYADEEKGGETVEGTNMPS